MVTSRLSTEQQIRSIWELGGLSRWQFTKKVWIGINEDDLFGRASELAYNFILSLFPLLLFLLALFGLFASQGTELRANLLFYFSHVLPPAAFQLVTKTIDEVTNNTGGGKLTFGIFMTVVLASGGMSSMMSTLNGAYRVHECRSWLKLRAIALGLTIATSVMLVLALIVILLGNYLTDLIGAKLNLGSAVVLGWKIMQWPIALFFTVVAFSLIYFFGPCLRKREWRWITPGAVFGVMLWLAASFGFRAYLH